MKTEAKNIGKWKERPCFRNIVYLGCKSKSGTSNSRVKTGHLRMSQEICEPHKVESTNEHQGTTENCRTGHCGPTSRSSSVRVHQLLSWEATLHVPYSLL